MPEGDVTSESIIPAGARSEAFFLAKEDGVLAGLEVASRVFAKIDPSVIFIERFRDGSSFRKGDKLARVKGPTIVLLKGERTALNFLQHLCGVATLTRRYRGRHRRHQDQDPRHAQDDARPAPPRKVRREARRRRRTTASASPTWS